MAFHPRLLRDSEKSCDANFLEIPVDFCRVFAALVGKEEVKTLHPSPFSRGWRALQDRYKG
jgi:hypothetical protein